MESKNQNLNKKKGNQKKRVRFSRVKELVYFGTKEPNLGPGQSLRVRMREDKTVAILNHSPWPKHGSFPLQSALQYYLNNFSVALQEKAKGETNEEIRLHVDQLMTNMSSCLGLTLDQLVPLYHRQEKRKRTDEDTDEEERPAKRRRLAVVFFGMRFF